VGIAKDVPRDDYIILEATIFPGINLFWAGTMLMMAALFFAAWDRLRQKKP
jgi:cytochrome c-type biogenesis protein CcmF